jgi:hypothetical protein
MIKSLQSVWLGLELNSCPKKGDRGSTPIPAIKDCEKYNESRKFVKEERVKGLDESSPCNCFL